MAEITGRYVAVDGRKTYYESCGSGPAVLLIHTAGRDNRQWHGVMELLAHRFELYAPDAPGHGKSWPRAGNRCIEEIHEIAEWHFRFMEAVGRRHFLVMGCSIGGNLSLLMASLGDTVKAVVGLQAADHTPTFTEGALDLMTHPHVNLMHANMDFSMSLVGSAAGEDARAFSEWGVLSLIPLAQQGDLRAYGRCDIRDSMANVRCPVLVARGTEDWLVSQPMVDATCERLVNASVVENRSLPGLGHFPHLEDPGAVAGLADTFFGRHAHAV